MEFVSTEMITGKKRKEPAELILRRLFEADETSADYADFTDDLCRMQTGE
jgi:hypothetical protein